MTTQVCVLVAYLNGLNLASGNFGGTHFEGQTHGLPVVDVAWVGGFPSDGIVLDGQQQ
jgi:hypothetical protein